MTTNYLHVLLKSQNHLIEDEAPNADWILIDGSLQKVDPKFLQKHQSKIIQLTDSPSSGSNVTQLKKPFSIDEFNQSLEEK